MIRYRQKGVLAGRRADSAQVSYSQKAQLGGDIATLFNIGPSQSKLVYLQLRALLDNPDFAGNLNQGITVSFSCDG